MAMHVAFPYVDILRYGGTIPGQPEGTAVFCCPDADTINVFKAEISVKNSEERLIRVSRSFLHFMVSERYQISWR